jgi:hypothetical protein
MITNEDNVGEIAIPATVDFHISLHGELGSLVVNGAKKELRGCNSACPS